MRQVPLTKGKFAVVDDADYELVSRYKWTANQAGRRWYARTYAPGIDGRQRYTFMHRLILGFPMGAVSDHINGNSLDNRRSNLRVCSYAENSRAFRQPKAHKTSAFRGVSWEEKRQRWYVQIKVNYQKIHVGRFDDEREAALAYDAAARKHFKIFAQPNFTNENGN